VFRRGSGRWRRDEPAGSATTRARPHPTVSTPVTWDEVSEAAEGRADLRFLWSDVLKRVEELGDVFAPVLEATQTLPTPAA